VDQVQVDVEQIRLALLAAPDDVRVPDLLGQCASHGFLLGEVFNFGEVLIR
jgi:hypothetical protein